MRWFFVQSFVFLSLVCVPEERQNFFLSVDISAGNATVAVSEKSGTDKRSKSDLSLLGICWLYLSQQHHLPVLPNDQSSHSMFFFCPTSDLSTVTLLFGEVQLFAPTENPRKQQTQNQTSNGSSQHQSIFHNVFYFLFLQIQERD